MYPAILKVLLPAETHFEATLPTMTSSKLNIVFGGGPIREGKHFPNATTIEELHKLLQEGGCNAIDTGGCYSNSEEQIGKTHSGERFNNDSKNPVGLFLVAATPQAFFSSQKKQSRGSVSRA